MAEKIHLMKILYKNTDTNKYEAVLSDDSIDRDNEIVGKKALEKSCLSDSYLPILMDHENKVLNQLGEWTNKRIEFRKGHNSFVAEPKFYESNPNALIIKGMLDEGAKIGISIGAMVNDYEEVERENKTYKQYTDIEIVEASFVGVPSNRNGVAQAVAKAYNKAIKNLNGVDNMTEEVIKKADFDSKVEELEKVNKSLEEVNKNLESKDAEIESLKKELEETKACGSKKEKEEDMEEDDKKESKSFNFEEFTKKFEEMSKRIEDLENQPVFKAHGESAENIKVDKIDEELSKGHIPILTK